MRRRSDLRLALVAVFVLALLVALAGRLIELTVVRGAALAEQADANRTRVIPQPAPRGMILDSAGRPLVANTAAAGVLIDRQALAAQPDHGAAVIAATARALGMTTAALQQRLLRCGTPGAPPRPICDDGSPQAPVSVIGADHAALLPIAENPGRYPGVTLTSAVRRAYPAGDVTGGHLLGYLGAVTADELAADGSLTAADLVGRGGLEQQYDDVLRGIAGRRTLRVDATGSVLGPGTDIPAVAGHDLLTSIDADLQAVSDTALRQALGQAGSRHARGAAVVLDVRAGRVLALSSAPGFSPAEWVGGISERRYRALTRSGALLDYPLSGTSPPGSAFKPMTVLAMARSGMSLTDAYDCPATFTTGGRTFSNHESEAYGRISLATALEVSCNTVFYRAGDDLWRAEGGEAQGQGDFGAVATAALDLGLGQRTGIDLPNEAAGLVASPDAQFRVWLDRKDAWCAAAAAGYPELRRTNPAKAKYFTALDRANCDSGYLWRPGDAINAAIGQGLTAITPIQLAVAYAAIGNGGTVFSPTVASAVLNADGSVAQRIDPVARRTLSDQATFRWLRRALTGVPLRGTAAAAFAGFPLERYPVAGKTGTAQVDGQGNTAWFASIAPANDPRYAVVVMVTNGGTGGETAAPAVRSIYDAIFGVGRPAVFGPDGPPEQP